MTGFVRKAFDLVLNGRAVSWTNPLDLSAVHCRTMNIIKYDLMGFGIGVTYIAGNFVFKLAVGIKRKRNNMLVALLFLKLIKVN